MAKMHVFHISSIIKADLLNDNMPYFLPQGPQKDKKLTDKDKWLKFKNYEKQLSSPFVIWADFECLLPKFQLLGPFCYKLITIVNCYLEAGLTCFVYCPKALYLIIFIVWHPF